MRGLIKVPAVFLFFLYCSINAQDLDISVQLKDIEAGKISKVKKDLAEMQKKYPNNPSVLYLDALLTEDGKSAVGKYSAVAENYPKSKYADASLFKVFSYYYATGAYRMAEGYFQQLKDTYPGSDYIPIALNVKEGKESSVIKPEPEKKITDTVQQQINQTSLKNDNKDNFGKYTIQAGAFISLNNARNLKKTFEDAGYFSEIKEKTIGGSVLNVVTVGRFESETQAQSELVVINKNFNLEGRVVPLY